MIFGYIELGTAVAFAILASLPGERFDAFRKLAPGLIIGMMVLYFSRGKSVMEVSLALLVFIALMLFYIPAFKNFFADFQRRMFR